MIHGNSQDPVIIKKINVKIWHLRDEIKATVEERIKNNPDEKSLSIDDLVEEYKLPPATGPVPGLSIAPDEADTEEQAEGEGREGFGRHRLVHAAGPCFGAGGMQNPHEVLRRRKGNGGAGGSGGREAPVPGRVIARETFFI